MAGLGHLDGGMPEQFQSDQAHEICDLLVIGAGPAGLIAANEAVTNGQSVILVDDHNHAGGSIYRCGKSL